MNNNIIIPNRLNWIDWAKTLAITFVVFGHIPMEKGNFIQSFIVVFHMPLFFYISGFLTKKEYPNKDTFKKYWHTLGIPYIIYNIIFYPYWVIRHVIDYPNAGWYDFIKPIIGTVMLQHKTPYYESLNGVTWFVSSLLIMKLILALCNKYKCKILVIGLLFFLDALIYIINEHYRFITDLPFVGFTRCFPFFILGHLCRQKNIISEQTCRWDWSISIISLCISLIAYSIIRTSSDIFLYGSFFWIICISSILGILCLCKSINKFHSKVIDNISIGTIVIMGLHWILIGATNFILSKLFSVNDITYSWYIAICLALLFIAILYPIILLFKNKYPYLLGKWRKT